jgi:MFS family permease
VAAPRRESEPGTAKAGPRHAKPQLPPSIDDLGRSPGSHGRAAAEVRDPADAETATLHPAVPYGEDDRPDLHVRLFGSHQFFRLWLAQVVASLGDWVGFAAIAFKAQGLGGDGSREAAIGIVMTARILPGFFLAPVAGILADRWDRKKVMVGTNLGRAVVVAALPFVTNVFQLVVASLLLESLTLLWSPAKEASVPNLVPQQHLSTANSLSLVAAYGTFPLGSAVFALMATLSEALEGLDEGGIVQTDQASLAFAFQALCFVVSAMMISTLVLPRQARAEVQAPADDAPRFSMRETYDQFRDGWRVVQVNPTVRAVYVGLATGLIGGGMLVPLGSLFSEEVLNAGASGYGWFITSLGFGVASGVGALSFLQKRLPKAQVFTGAVLGAGLTLFAAASFSSLLLSATFVFLMGACAGAVYVLGFTMLHEEVDDEVRGRVFAGLYTLVRLCVLLAFALAPFLTALLGSISKSQLDEQLDLFGFSLFVPGVRLTLWLAAAIITLAGLLAIRSVRNGQRQEAKVTNGHPTNGGARAEAGEDPPAGEAEPGDAVAAPPSEGAPPP